MQITESKNVIIGAGAMGSAAAYHLARRGEPVTLIEQFALGHDRGSSHGAARITRHSYADPACARMMPEAFRAWKALEADAGETVYIRTGGVSFSPPGVDYVAKVVEHLDALGVPYWHGSVRAWKERQRVFDVPAEYDVVFEPDAGMLVAARAVALQVELARFHGGARTRVLDHTPVTRIDLDGSRPVVVTGDSAIVAERLVVSAGAWVKKLLPGLPVPLCATRQQVLYFCSQGSAAFQIGRFPIFMYVPADEHDVYYGMPEFQGLGVKVARHSGPEVDPDIEDRTVGEPYRSEVRGFLQKHIPSLADAPIERTEICLYTVAPGDRFLVDFLPGRRDVIVASPCSGHGFKFSCLIGRVLADLAATGTTPLAIDAWRIEESPGPQTDR
jgi:sarcosine oxidase